MKKFYLSAIVAALASFAFAQDLQSGPIAEESIAQLEQEWNPYRFELSVHSGLYTFDETKLFNRDKDCLEDFSPFVQANILLKNQDSRLAVSASGWSSSTPTDYEHGDVSDLTTYGFSTELLAYLLNSESFNFYISGGVFFEKFDCDVYFYDDSGFTWITHAGVEYNIGKAFFFQLEAGILGEVYDKDKTQLDISATAGYFVLDNLRIDLFTNYKTEWEELDLGIGLALVF